MDWRKSTYSDSNGGQCVETASGNGLILVRDTTDRDGGTLSFPQPLGGSSQTHSGKDPRRTSLHRSLPRPC